MIRLLSSAILLTASFAQTAPTATTEVWAIDGDVQGVPVVETCTFTHTDAMLSGACVIKDLPPKPATGTVTGKNITFSHHTDYEGQDLTLTFSGELNSEGKLNGTIDVQPMDVAGSFTATKK